MNWASFFNGLGGLSTATIGSLTAAGVIGGPSGALGHATTQVVTTPAGTTITQTPYSSPQSNLLFLGAAILLVVLLVRR